MKTVGLITEYNPFHNGHLYHLKKAKELTNADYVVVLMSGNFLQRGTPACTDKYTRTRMALSQGADLVFELPMYYATGSAEFFASGAISVFRQLGIIDSICFGAETDDLTSLQSIADILANEPSAFKLSLSHYLKEGNNFPIARKKALCDFFGNTISSDFLESPNNILGIEYLKAIKQQEAAIQPYILKRTVSGYHDTALNEMCISSASSIRSHYHFTNSLATVRPHLPKEVFSILEEAEGKYFPISEDDLSQMLYYSLLHQTTEELTSYMDVTEELARRIKNNLYLFENFSSFAEKLKTKTYTLTRIYRALLHILLKIRKNNIQKEVPYVRLLGMKKTSGILLKNSRQFTQQNGFTIIQKPSLAKELLTPEIFALYENEITASHLYQQMIYHKFHYRMPMEYQRNLIIL